MIEQILYNGTLYAIIIRHSFSKEGVAFFTPNDFSQQLGYMRHPAGKVIQPHFHNAISRQVVYTQEVLVIKQGKLRVNFYDYEKIKRDSRVLLAGDVILLAHGGHGFEVLEEVAMFEVKQGPYMGEEDKTRFFPKECIEQCQEENE